MSPHKPLEGYTVIYGGSFNPPHIGHQIACMWLLDALGADRVAVIPTYKHAFGKELLGFEHRVKMCEIMVEKMGGWKDGTAYGAFVDRCEERLPHPNITLNTVKSYRESWDKVAVAIGSDLLHDLDEWTGWGEVLDLARVVVVGRTGGGHADHDYELFEYPVELSAVSSSQVRGQIRRGKAITGLVPAKIAEYIKEHALYL